MIDLQIYASGLRKGDTVIHLGHALETHPEIRYKVDPNHDMVYFEFDDQPKMTLSQIKRLFDNLGLPSRVVGILPPELQEASKETEKLNL